MDHDHARSVRSAAPDAPAASRQVPPRYGGSTGAIGSSVTPGAQIRDSSAAVRATGTAGRPTVTSAPPPALARFARKKPVVHIPRIPPLRPQRLFVPIAIALVLWVLVIQLIGAHQMSVVLSSTDAASVVGALVVTQLASIGAGIGLWGGVNSFVRFDVLLRAAFAMAFAEFIGGPVATVATAASLHRQHGHSPPGAYGSALLSSAAGIAVPLVIGIGFLPVAWRDFHLVAAGPYGSNPLLLQLVLLAVVATGLVGGLTFVVPRVRHAWALRGRPAFAEIWANVFEVTSHIGPVVRLIAGPALMQFAFAAGLGWCANAVGASVNFSALILVCCAASVLGGITPVPGGMGVVEATYISGLTAVGVPQDLAAGATLFFRACTTYVPALWGWPALAWLREEDDPD